MLQSSWSDVNLSWKLVNAITEDVNIKNGLFPPPGSNASTQNGGGKKKIEWCWKLAEILFKDDPTYRNNFSEVIEANQPQNKVSKAGKSRATKLRNEWAEKIKNRLAK
jgi:hypothetical protein